MLRWLGSFLLFAVVIVGFQESARACSEYMAISKLESDAFDRAPASKAPRQKAQEPEELENQNKNQEKIKDRVEDVSADTRRYLSSNKDVPF